MSFAALTPREASIFACVCETMIAPQPRLPPVRETDAVRSFDSWLAQAPRPHRIALRALLYAAEVAPRALGLRRRLRQLSDSERGRVLRAAERSRAPQLRQLVKALESMAYLSYYGDEGVMRRLGYDAADRVRRARELRERERRP